jgi:hypothetical protein
MCYIERIAESKSVTLRLTISSSWRQALEIHDQYFSPQLNTCGYSPYVSSLMREWVCRLQLLLVLAGAVKLRSESRGTHDHIFLSQIRGSPNLEGQISVFISPRNRVARLYLQALGSLFVASYDSQGYGGGIRPRLHTGRVADELFTSISRSLLLSGGPERKHEES